jgi:uncharacterized protein YaaW (UPF0174 family)
MDISLDSLEEALSVRLQIETLEKRLAALLGGSVYSDSTSGKGDGHMSAVYRSPHMNRLSAFIRREWSRREMSEFAEILDVSDATWAETPWTDAPDLLAEILRSKAEGGWQTLRRLAGSDSLSYRDVVRAVADKMGVPYGDVTTAPVLERRIVVAYAETFLNRLDPEKRRKLAKEIERQARKAQSKPDAAALGAVVAGGGLVAAELSGFAVYLLATTSLHAAASALGVTLAFATYAALTRAMGVIIGPVGWIGAALFAAWAFTRPNMKRVTAAILYIAAVRARRAA